MLPAVNPLAFVFLGYGAAIVVSSIVVALMVILGRSKLWMPFEIDFKLVADADLSEHEARFMREREAELTALGFRAVVTYRFANGPRPVLVRLFLDPTTTVLCTVQAMTTSKKWEAHFLSMSSYAADDRAVETRNMPGVPVFAKLPGHVVVEDLMARNAASMLSTHREAVEKAGIAAIPQEATRLLEESVRRYRAYCEFQEKQGVFRRDEARQRWVGSVRAQAAMVTGQLLPSRGDLEAPRVVRAVIAGAIVPAIVVIWSYSQAGAWILLAHAAIFSSGVVASTYFTARAWPWAIILGTLPLLCGRWTGPDPAFMLFFGTLIGNVFTLRRKGLIAPQPGGNRRTVIIGVVAGLICLLLFFSFYAFFSRQAS
jgi:hypothetical protein